MAAITLGHTLGCWWLFWLVPALIIIITTVRIILRHGLLCLQGSLIDTCLPASASWVKGTSQQLLSELSLCLPLPSLPVMLSQLLAKASMRASSLVRRSDTLPPPTFTRRKQNGSNGPELHILVFNSQSVWACTNLAL